MRQWTEEQGELIELGPDGLPRLARVAVTADAGSGKTAVLVERARRILEAAPAGVGSDRVLCVSFTEKSKADLERRLSDLPGAEVYTIHGYCGRVVSEFGSMLGLSPCQRILDNDECNDMFYQAFERVCRRAPPKNAEHGLATFFTLCQRAWFAGPDEAGGYARIIDESGGRSDPNGSAAFVAEVLSEFERSKERLRALEFADLERFAAGLLRRGDVIARLRQRYRHVFVDEFQDTSHVQCGLVRAICGERGPIFVVGDSKQSIYRFRGADVGVFEEFIGHFPRHRLSKNFRSHPLVLDAVNSVCASQIEGYAPMVVGKTRERAWPQGMARVARVTAETDEEAIEAVLRRLSREGVDWSEVALLLRRMKGNEKLFADLTRRGIAIAATSAGSASLDERLGKLVNLWVWACEPWQNLRAAQVAVEFLGQGLGPETGDRRPVTSDPGSGGDFTGVDVLRSNLWGGMESLRSPLTDMADLSCEELLERLDRQFALRVRLGSAYEQFRLFVLRHQDEGLRPAALARRLDRLAGNGQDIPGFVLVPPPSNLRGALRALTIHAAKGLEFPVAILADLSKRRARGGAVVRSGREIWLLGRDEKGELDKSPEDVKAALAAESDAEREESARLLYVAMTRAEEALYVVDRPALAEDEVQKIRPAKDENTWAEWLRKGLSDCGAPTIPAEVFSGSVTVTAPAEAEASAATIATVEALSNSPPVYRPARIGITTLADRSLSLSTELKLQTETGTLSGKLSKQPPQVSRGSGAIRILYSADVDPRELGTRIHSHLENLAWDALRAEAVASGLDLASFFRWLDTSEAAAVFSTKGCERAYSEFAFEWHTSEGIAAGRIDRLLVFPVEAWVVDYKVLLHPRSVEDLIASYRSQLQLYAQAVRELTSIPRVRAFLLDITGATGSHWHEVLE